MAKMMPTMLPSTLLPPLHTSWVVDIDSHSDREGSTRQQQTHHQTSRVLPSTCCKSRVRTKEERREEEEDDQLVAAFQRFIRLLVGAAQDDICFLWRSGPSHRVGYSNTRDGSLQMESIDETRVQHVPSDFVLHWDGDEEVCDGPAQAFVADVSTCIDGTVCSLVSPNHRSLLSRLGPWQLPQACISNCMSMPVGFLR